jgi:hypothetical protein
MGKLRNFDKIKFKPFGVRHDNLKVTNFYADKDGKKHSLQSHLGCPKYSHWEILGIQPNVYYGREQEFRENGYVDSFGGEFLQGGGHSIQKSFFDSPETHYVIASWTNIDHDEKSPDLKFVGSRPLDLAIKDQRTFMILAKIGQQELEKQLGDFNEDDFNEDAF